MLYDSRRERGCTRHLAVPGECRRCTLSTVPTYP
jgi:hypothetical protein